jgi:hypothetical protein
MCYILLQTKKLLLKNKVVIETHSFRGTLVEIYDSICGHHFRKLYDSLELGSSLEGAYLSDFLFNLSMLYV